MKSSHLGVLSQLGFEHIWSALSEYSIIWEYFLCFGIENVWSVLSEFIFDLAISLVEVGRVSTYFSLAIKLLCLDRLILHVVTRMGLLSW